MKLLHRIWISLSIVGIIVSCTNENKNQLDLSSSTILVSPSIESTFRQTAGVVLMEEIEKRTSLKLETSESWDNKTTIALALSNDKNLFGEKVPSRKDKNLPEFKEEGFRLFEENKKDKNYGPFF